jgi:hypothetical protein
MDLKSASELINYNLPSSITIKSVTSYALKWTYVDPAGDESMLEVSQAGIFCTFEDAGNGTEWSIEVLDFLWRVSRIIRDLPW